MHKERNKYIFIYVQTCVYIYMYIYIYVNTYIFIHIHVYLHVHIYIHVYIHVHIYIYVHMHIYVYIYIYVYICMSMCIRMHFYRKMAGDIRQRMLVFSAHVRHTALSEALVLLANSDNPLPDTKKGFLDRSI